MSDHFWTHSTFLPESWHEISLPPSFPPFLPPSFPSFSPFIFAFHNYHVWSAYDEPGTVPVFFFFFYHYSFNYLHNTNRWSTSSQFYLQESWSLREVIQHAEDYTPGRWAIELDSTFVSSHAGATSLPIRQLRDGAHVDWMDGVMLSSLSVEWCCVLDGSARGDAVWPPWEHRLGAIISIFSVPSV